MTLFASLAATLLESDTKANMLDRLHSLTLWTTARTEPWFVNLYRADWSHEVHSASDENA